jgi:hypothetical protein
MFVDVSTVRSGNKTYTRYLLRESYRDNGKVKHRTIANLSQCSPAEIEAIRLALSHKSALTNLGSIEDAVQLSQGESIGALALLYGLAQEVGLIDALGSRREGKLALWQIIARVIDQGSRLSAVRLARQHAALELLQTVPFDEDDLYENLDWLCEKQEEIEQALFTQHARKGGSGLFLYDVTSSYLEGEHNALAAFGYNRDGKKGKRQIVVGLLCDAEGTPLSIEVFEGNTQDQKTLLSQVKKVAARFGGGDVTFVGDRGMIKSQQIEALGEQGFHYITAITKPQIERLIKQGAIQIELFDDELAEINDDAGIRYVLRRNPLRAEEMAGARQQKYQTLLRLLNQKNEHLRTHPRAKPTTAFRAIAAKARRLGIQAWVTIIQNDRVLTLSQNADVLTELADLDGCYALKTDLPAAAVSKAIVHERYKDLAQVEWAFRTIKTTHLEMRPVFVRSAAHTRGHALVVLLAYRLVKVLAERWRALDLTVQEGIQLLSTLCLVQVKINDHVPYNEIPRPSPQIKQLFECAQIRLPSALPGNPQKVDTKTKLQNRRKQK